MGDVGEAKKEGEDVSHQGLWGIVGQAAPGVSHGESWMLEHMRSWEEGCHLKRREERSQSSWAPGTQREQTDQH